MNTEQKLRKQINDLLQRITEANSPELYKLIAEGNYATVEDSVIRMVIANGITPDAAIPFLETEYSMI